MIEVERTSRNVLTVRFPNVIAGQEFWTLLRADAHHDHVKCNRTLEKKHLDMMVKRGGYWMDFGDLSDAMQGRYDPRRNYSEVRLEDVGMDYYDRVIDHAAEFYGPYAESCLLLATGNHESGALKHANHDLTRSLVDRLNNGILKDKAHRIEQGCYGGWIRFVFEINHSKRTRMIALKYFHGAGGRAPVTKGVIQTNRQAVFLPDANIVINGHNHQNYILVLGRERLGRTGKVYQDLQWHGRIPGYKDAYGDGGDGWEVEKGMEPTPLGALWLHFSMHDHDIKYKLITEIE